MSKMSLLESIYEMTFSGSEIEITFELLSISISHIHSTSNSKIHCLSFIELIRKRQYPTASNDSVGICI